ncbi:MAG: NAD(P)/FAD-dependent oxidoreductase [Acidobacteriota bacterium]|nr:NAD(P)/FAD-dependent oxidoreductase [Acidobacteriota bacterium]
MLYDTIIVGGGPAGLSAALILGRSRRRVLLCDAGKQRNLPSHAMHGYLTRDGIAPAEFLKVAYEEVARYGIEVRRCVVKAGAKVEGGFEVVLEDDSRHRARKLLIATGVADQLPAIPDVKDFYGTSVHHCPYCDGWEHRDSRIAVYSKKPGLAYSLTTWSKDVVLLTDGPARLTPADRGRLERHRIPVRKDKIARLEGPDGRLERIVFASGEVLDRDAIFFSTAQHQACDLLLDLGCILNHRGTVDTDRLEMSRIPGIYIAGDASKDAQMVIVAAAEGAKAAIAINTSLQQEDGVTPAE